MSGLSGSSEDLDNDDAPRNSILVDEFASDEELLSLSNSPDSNSSEDLPSLPNSETYEENVSQPSPSSGGGRDISIPDRTSGNVSTNQESSPNIEELAEEQPSTSRGTTIRSFKTKVDENGETIFIFASDDEESVSEQENEELDHQPLPPSNQPNVSWQSQLETIRREQSTQYQTTTNNQHGVGTNLDWVSEDSDEDPDYSPASTNSPATRVAQRAAARRNIGSELGHILGSQESEVIVTHLGTVRRVQVGGTRRTTTGTRRRRKKKRAKIPVKQSTVQRVSKPIKPLLPKTIFHDENGNETAKMYRSQIASSTNHKTNVAFTTTASNENENSLYYKVGEVFLKMTNPEDELRIVNYEMLLVNFPGLKQVILHSADYRDVALMELKTELTLSEEEAARRPKPKLNKSDVRRSLIFVARKMYLFPCRIERFDTKLFTSKGFGNKKVFLLEFVGFCEERKRIKINILLNKTFIIGPHTLNDIPYSKNKILSDTLNSLFDVKAPPHYEPIHDNDETQTLETSTKEDIPWFYGQIKKYHDKEVLPTPTFSLQPKIVGPTLRQYQKNAVQWMLYREGALTTNSQSTELTPKLDIKASFINKMYVPVSIEGKQAFYNPHIGYMCWQVPILDGLPSGGILADEMGLGKTVEVICLVLLNPKPMEESKENQSDVDDEESIYNADDNSSRSGSNYSSSEDVEESSSESWHRSSKRKRTSDVNNTRKSSRTYSKLANSEHDSQAPVHPKFKGKRSISPCTFVTISCPTNDPDDKSSGVNDSCDDSSVENEIIPSSSSSSSCHQKIKNSSSKRQATEAVDSKTGIPKKILKTSARSATFLRLNAVYEAELFNYNESRNVSRKKFNGTFFDTKIARILRFECICGGNNDTKEIVVCSICHSSQHSSCVGHEKYLLRHSPNKKYICPHCTTIEPPFPAKTTLIVTPSTISHQWINELKRHVNKDNMSIMFYKGVTNHGYIPPSKLAEFDIVITTYNILANELNYVDLPHTNSEDGRRFRNAKRFMTIPSPLPSVYWYRVCLDEAQIVEGISTKMSMMALKFKAHHRWCITGTPINEGLRDLFGLFAFLSVEPVALDFWWQKLVQEPFHRKDVSLLYELFGQVIWRTGKTDVLDQLGIPPQTSMHQWLTFSAVEDHFYKQQYEICSKKILEKISRLRQLNSNILESRLSTLDRQILQSLLLPFLELRKACCHPQMVKGHSFSLQKDTMTMEELLAQLIKKTSVQCADDHRQIVASLNGMAGIHMIKENWLAASEMYREVLQSAEKNDKHFSTDSLQLYHTKENLADLLDRHHDGVPYTLRDSSLRTEAEDLKKKYLQKYSNSVKAAQMVVTPLSKVTEELPAEFKCHNSSWWSIALTKASKLDKIDEFVKRIKHELSGGPDVKQMKNFISLANKFNDANGLERVLVENILEIDKLRKSALEGLDKLQQQGPNSFVHAAISCHLRKKAQLYYKESDELGFRCQLCQYHDLFLRYESALFKEKKRKKIVRTGRQWQQHKILGDVSSDLTEDERNLVLLKEEEELIDSLEHCNVGLSDAQRQGTWGDSDTEKILKLINNFARINRLPGDVRHDGTTHIKLFDAMKKEFRFLRILWRQIYDEVSAYDELSQATTRLCLKYNVEVSSSSVVDQQVPSTSTGGGGGSSRRKKKPPVKELQSGQIEQDQRIQNINVLEPHELDTKIAQMQLELELGKSNLSVHMGQLLYLETLKKKDYGKQGTVNSEDCPVCQCPLNYEWSVLCCGHSFCSDCVKQMCPNVSQSFFCPLCRTSVKYSDVSFVDTKGTETSSPSKRSTRTRHIKGSHSTKVEAVVETLLRLQDSHPTEKVIIFSTWVDVLEIISKALAQNDISNCLLNQSGKKFETELQRFKQTEDIQVLLMPLSSGSKGLNIIEATHIILVEPILSLASELQAIGRIHRIGQTKPTFVHRLYVKSTIEEQLFEVLKGHDVSSDAEGSLTVADLQSLIKDGKNYSGPSMVTLD